MSDQLTRYDGGKNGAGVYQAIINAIPAHIVYVEAFAGSAAIYRRKKWSASSVLVEKNPAIFARLQRYGTGSTIVINDDAVQYLTMLAKQKLEGYFIYLDPPYLHETRKDKALYGKFELDDGIHRHLVTSLLPALSAAGALWGLSGYRSAMYDDAAASSGWFRKDFNAMTRKGLAVESLWTNYNPETTMPAEFTYAGISFRDRERLKRKAARWCAKLAAMPPGERAFILAMLEAGDARSCTVDSGDGIHSPEVAMGDRQ